MRKFEWERKLSKIQPTSKENITIIRALNNFGRIPEQHELLDEIEKLQQENEKLMNNWNELKKWLDIKEEKETVGTFSDVLDKIKELESK